ncbi:hypothetical protein CDD80_4426 [Ophiocordyceps camponoti-rufipedis]|uniref:NADH:ubiquinone oxidoreductase intermediate-associated protein 30 domain-containing protein n=1 Tax=Ophiocordyceps camponoti-rufipedis TaxID=2004952 RepID=A0A2C5XHH9_9HYPO|nr:hypothetical protein CDD80_4426 [Ophiocordyceps camponoti-rufipedis]
MRASSPCLVRRGFLTRSVDELCRRASIAWNLEGVKGAKKPRYAAFRTPDQPPTLFGRSVWDVDPYAYLALRVKSDGRAYFVNLQAESVEMTDLHQHRLFVRRPGVWETVLLPWSEFVRTNYGSSADIVDDSSASHHLE